MEPVGILQNGKIGHKFVNAATVLQFNHTKRST